MLGVSLVVIVLLWVTIVVWIRVEFVHAILRAEIECAAFMFAFREGFL